MRVVLEIKKGPLSGQALHVEEGETRRVGRGKKADLSLPADHQLSGAHFAVERRGGAVVVRDLESSNGTFVNGDRVVEARLRDGDRVRAGETTFHVRFFEELHEAPAKAAPATPSALEGPALPPPMAEVQSLLLAEGAPCFALLDAARDRRVSKLIQRAGGEAASLYDGWQSELLADYAPHLVHLPPGAPTLHSLLLEGWGKSWGVYVTSDRPFVEVRRHFRRFLMVKDDDTQEELYFRFYDPRVLRVFLGCATPRQAGLFFEDVGAFLLEGDTPNTLQRWSRAQHEDGVTRAVIPLSP